MNPKATAARLASVLHRRFKARMVGPGQEATAPAAAAPPSPAFAGPPPMDEQTTVLSEKLRRRILEKWGRPNQAADRDNNLNHVRRYTTSLRWLPPGGRILDPAGGGGLFVELLREERHCELVTPGAFFDLEKQPAPFGDEEFDGVLLMEVLEHFSCDPMYALAEINRVLRPGGYLFLTTPNIASWRSLFNMMHGCSPYLYGIFLRNGTPDRHNREYTTEEVGRLVQAAGFRVERLEGINVYPSHDHIPITPGASTENRGDTTFCLARKEGPVRDRYPDWLYYVW